MDYKEFNVDLQIKENHIKIIRGIEQYDGANKLNIRLMDGSDVFAFSDYSDIECFIKKPDDTFITDLIDTRLQVVDADEGKLSFLLSGQCTLVTGMHFLTIRIYDGTTVLSTARLNYYVQEANADNISETEIQSVSEWNSITQMIARGAEMTAAEQMRQVAEAARVAAENGRVSETAGIVAQAEAIKLQAQTYAALAEEWANAAQTIALGGDLPVVLRDELELRLSTLSGNDDTILTRHGLAEDIPALLQPGELYLATDTGLLYAGTAAGNICVNPTHWVADGVAPEDTGLIWIDTANDNSIKFYDDSSSSWVSTANLTFA